MTKKKLELMSKKGLLKRSMPYIKKYKGFVFLTLLLSIIVSVLSALTPFITKNILDEYLPNNDYDTIIKMLIIYGVIIVATFIFRYLFNYINTLTGMKIEKLVRDDAIRKIDYLPVDYFSLEPDGKIVAKITSDTAGVRAFYTTLFTIVNAILNIVIVYVGVLIIEPILGLLVLVLVPILLLWVTVYRRFVHKFYVDLRETGSRITGKLNELITGTLIIQDFNQENYMLEDYNTLVRRYVHNDRITSNINNFLGWELLSLIKRITEILLLIYLGFSSINIAGAVIGIGLIAALSENLDKMINPVNAIFNNLNELEDSLVGATRAYALIDEPNDIKIFDGKEAPEVKGEVEFRNVSFAYVDDKYVLNNINLRVEAGKTIGIVGHTGSGKSSMMNLILGYNDAQKGKILIDGVDMTTYNKASLRKNMGIVLQTPALFAGTLKTNITLERDYSDEEVLKVLEAVGAKYMVDKSPDGLNQIISYRGENLSLGEKQLISFARILLRNPKILVLDEATANIDTKTEKKIKEAMDVIAKGRTTFIIAHRLSTIKNADEIIVLDKGNLVGKGSHEELYESCIEYKKIYDNQK